jgi:CRP-like cAMP-binding protein
MKQKTHYSEALAYLRDYCLRHGRLMHFSHGDIFEAEGAAARLFGYIESGSFHYLVRNYEGGESTVETVAAGDLVGCYPYCLDGDAAPVTIRADKSSTVYVVDGADLNEHYCQSQAAERMGRDYMAYRLEQVKSQIYSHYCEKGVRDV